MLNGDTGSSNAVTAIGHHSPKAVGPTVYLPVHIGGVAVEVVVDTGSQSTIILRSMFLEMDHLLRRSGQLLPVLKKVTTKS